MPSSLPKKEPFDHVELLQEYAPTARPFGPSRRGADTERCHAVGGTWDAVLKVLRDPLFAVGLSIFLAILASRVGGCVVRLLLVAGSAAAFIWLLVRFEPFENVVVALVSVLGTLLVVLAICLAVIAVVAIFAVHAMHRRSTTVPLHIPVSRPVPTSRPPSGDHSVADRLEARRDHVLALETHLGDIVESVFDTDSDRITQLIGTVTTGYFSGLTAHLPDLRQLNHEIDAALTALAAELPRHFTGIDEHRLHAIAAARTYLMTKADWDAWLDSHSAGFAYLAVRLLCLRRDWRLAATIVSKCHYAHTLLDDCLYAL
ncbi:hypothetical protein [Actinophytocola sp.]|uniref:hypothetical protein n=1 Tax=Actinophytocola sp. TaxID=1872138 RepID=UPI002D80654A|nr:hypothetical protein [Actinophytocola sp.]HET9138197.1 hypothetical protein [Actinophytocola sp.]